MRILLALCVVPTIVLAGGTDDQHPNTLQYYSGKFGYYHPSEALNNGLIVGLDGITEFVRYNFFISGAVELYPKQSVGVFQNPQPNGNPAPGVSQQQLFLIPIHVNVAYKLLDFPDADSRFYVGIGGGYYFYFYSATYTTQSGSLLGGSLTSASDSKNGGNVFGAAFARILVNKIFVEPRVYLATSSNDEMGGNRFVVDPSGFSVTLGFQYH